MLNVITLGIIIKMSKMTTHCVGIVQMKEESGSGKWQEMWFKTTADDGERGGQQWRAGGVRLFHRRAAATGNTLSPTVDRWVRRTSGVIAEAERSRRLTSVSNVY